MMTHLTSALPLLHMGALHAYEKLLVLLLAFGPLVALVAVVYVVRRRDLAAEADRAAEPSPGEPGPPRSPTG